jgi:outer membrane protein assembly factor BamB
MTSNHGEESQALIKDGVIYVTSHDKAVDALTGKEIWKTLIEYAPEGQELSAAASSTAAPRAKPNLDLAHPLHQSTSGGQSSL